MGKIEKIDIDNIYMASDYGDNDFSTLNNLKRISKAVSKNKTIDWLERHNIDAIPSSVDGIVEIQTPSTKIYVSLKSKLHRHKLRFEGSKKWYDYKKSSILNLLKY